MRTVPNRGASSKLADLIRQLPTGSVVTTDTAYEMLRAWKPTITRQATASALSYLAGHGVLMNGGLQGNYRLAPSNAAPLDQRDVDTVAIDALLDAMAQAEPVLRRCKKLIAAFKA